MFWVLLPLLVGALVVTGMLFGYVKGGAVKEMTLAEEYGLKKPYRDPAKAELLKDVGAMRILRGMPSSIQRIAVILFLIVVATFTGGIFMGSTGVYDRPIPLSNHQPRRPVVTEEQELAEISRLYGLYTVYGDIAPVSAGVRQLNFSRLAAWSMNTTADEAQQFFVDAVVVRNRASDRATMSKWIREVWSIEYDDSGVSAARIQLRRLCLQAMQRIWPIEDSMFEAVVTANNGSTCAGVPDEIPAACWTFGSPSVSRLAADALHVWHSDHPEEVNQIVSRLGQPRLSPR